MNSCYLPRVCFCTVCCLARCPLCGCKLGKPFSHAFETANAIRLSKLSRTRISSPFVTPFETHPHISPYSFSISFVPSLLRFPTAWVLETCWNHLCDHSDLLQFQKYAMKASVRIYALLIERLKVEQLRRPPMWVAVVADSVWSLQSFTLWDCYANVCIALQH